MTAAPAPQPLLQPLGYHIFGPGLSCVDCGWDWPCPPYQNTLRRVYGTDTAGITTFMTCFLAPAAAAAPHLSDKQIHDRLIGWCTTPPPEDPAPPIVAGRPVPSPRAGSLPPVGASGHNPPTCPVQERAQHVGVA